MNTYFQNIDHINMNISNTILWMNLQYTQKDIQIHSHCLHLRTQMNIQDKQECSQ